MSREYDFSGIPEKFEQKIMEGTLTNASLMILSSGGEKLHCHLGYLDKDNGIAIGGRPFYRFASMTKPITGAAVMIAVERGLAELDAPIDRYIPEFKRLRLGILNDEDELIETAALDKKPTVRHVLCHAGGLGHNPLASQYYSYVFGNEKRSLEEMMPYIADIPLAFAPGTRSNYNGVIGFNILARIVEIVTRTPFEDFIRNEIFDPLEMREITFFPTDKQWKNTAVPYRYENGELTRCDLGTLNGTESCPYSCVGGWAGLVGPMEDYAHFAEMLLREGIWRGRRVLKAETVREMRTPQLFRYPLTEESVLDWGLSMRVVTKVEDRLPIGCYGWSGAYKTHFWVDPAHDLAALFGTSVISDSIDHNPHFDFERYVAEAIKNGEK